MSDFSSLQQNEPLYLAPRHRAVLLKLLQRYLPGRTVWAFGSRATGRHIGRFSDLDLAVEQGLPLGLRSDLMDALDESNLPVNVDLVELEYVDPKFAERIRPDFVLVQAGDVKAVSEADLTPAAQDDKFLERTAA